MKKTCLLAFRASEDKQKSLKALSELTGKTRSAVMRDLIPNIKAEPTTERKPDS